MINSFVKFSIASLAILFLATSFNFVNAQTDEEKIDFTKEDVKDLANIEFKVVSLVGFGSIQEFVLAILNVFIVIATPIIVLAIIYAGFLYVTARGNAEQTKKATTALTYAIIGGLLILGAVALGEVLKGVIDAFLAE